MKLTRRQRKAATARRTRQIGAMRRALARAGINCPPAWFERVGVASAPSGFGPALYQVCLEQAQRDVGRTLVGGS